MDLTYNTYISSRRNKEGKKREENAVAEQSKKERERGKGGRRERERERGRKVTPRTEIEGVHQAKLTLLHSRASALCSSFCLKQLLHLLLLNMLGANFLHSAPVPRMPPAVPPDIATRAN